MILIKNGTVYDAVNREPYKADILVKDGKIAEIGENLSAECEVFDAEGLNIYPGFVEAHCHIGLDGSGIGFEGDDCNEMTDILNQLEQEASCLQLKDLAVGGRDLMALGYAGPAIGKALSALLEAVLSEELPNEKAALLEYLQQDS
jgi:predicted amidohydrolase YtcJ